MLSTPRGQRRVCVMRMVKWKIVSRVRGGIDCIGTEVRRNCLESAAPTLLASARSFLSFGRFLLRGYAVVFDEESDSVWMSRPLLLWRPLAVTE